MPEGIGLPVLDSSPESPSAPASSPGRRRAWVFLLVHLAIAFHIAWWWRFGRAVSPLEPSEAMELSKHGVVNAGAVFFLLAILSTFLFGRFFCGWACHMLALQDFCGWILRRLGLRPRPLRSRVLLWVPAAAFVYMFVWPLIYRLWIGDGLLEVRRVELMTEDFWATFPAWPVALVTFAVCGFAVVYFLGNKGFCAYACPYGAAFSVADRWSPLRIRVSDACTGCAQCTAVCTSNVTVHREVADYGAVVSSGCMKCLDCVASCPTGALGLGWGKPAALLTRSRSKGKSAPTASSPSFRDELILSVAFVFAFFTLRGLYGRVPFLLALGASAILASLVLTTWRWATGRRTGFPGISLGRFGRRGRWTRVDRGFAVVVGLGAVLWLHSAWIRGHEWRADAAWADGDWSTFDRHAEVATEHGLLPRPDLQLRLAGSALQQGDLDVWDLRLLAAAEAGASEAAVLRVRAQGFEMRGETGPAVETYERLIAATPLSEGAYIRLARLWHRAGDPVAASRVLERGLAARGRTASARLLYLAGTAAAQCGDLTASEARLRRALQRDPEFMPARRGLERLTGAPGGLPERVAPTPSSGAEGP